MGQKTLRECCIKHRLIFVFKTLNCNGQQFFSNYFTQSSHVHNTRRNSLDLVLPKVNTESAKKGSFYLGAKDFNELPKEVKEIKSLLLFKTKLVEVI